MDMNCDFDLKNKPNKGLKTVLNPSVSVTQIQCSQDTKKNLMHGININQNLFTIFPSFKKQFIFYFSPSTKINSIYSSFLK